MEDYVFTVPYQEDASKVIESVAMIRLLYALNKVAEGSENPKYYIAMKTYRHCLKSKVRSRLIEDLMNAQTWKEPMLLISEKEGQVNFLVQENNEIKQDELTHELFERVHQALLMDMRAIRSFLMTFKELLDSIE